MIYADSFDEAVEVFSSVEVVVVVVRGLRRRETHWLGLDCMVLWSKLHLGDTGDMTIAAHDRNQETHSRVLLPTSYLGLGTTLYK